MTFCNLIIKECPGIYTLSQTTSFSNILYVFFFLFLLFLLHLHVLRVLSSYGGNYFSPRNTFTVHLKILLVPLSIFVDGGYSVLSLLHFIFTRHICASVPILRMFLRMGELLRQEVLVVFFSSPV